MIYRYIITVETDTEEHANEIIGHLMESGEDGFDNDFDFYLEARFDGEVQND